MIKDYKQRDFVMNTLMLPVLFAAPLFYSLENAPVFLRLLSQINPLTYQLEAMRTIAFSVSDYTYILAVLILAVCFFVLLPFVYFMRIFLWMSIRGIHSVLLH